jgi:ribosomal protein S18 acetylase RimI-like enzyme
MQDITIRPVTPADAPFLWDMLYEAIYVPEGEPRPSRDLLSLPEISHYVAGWGQPGDYGLIAVDAASGRRAGAAWLRLLTGANAGFGYVDDGTPELSIALAAEYRGQGIGSALLRALLAHADSRYAAVSLSVDPRNPALRLYERLGFVAAGINGTSVTMIRRTRQG